MIKRIGWEAGLPLRWLFSALASIIGMGETPSSIGLMRSINPAAPCGKGQDRRFWRKIGHA